MNLRRLRGPLVAGITTLLIAGASGGAALAADPSSPASITGAAAEEPVSTGADTDLVEVQDQSGAADAAEAEAQTPEADGPGGNADVGENIDHQFDGEE